MAACRARILADWDNTECTCGNVGVPHVSDPNFQEHSMFCQMFKCYSYEIKCCDPDIRGETLQLMRAHNRPCDCIRHAFDEEVDHDSRWPRWQSSSSCDCRLCRKGRMPFLPSPFRSCELPISNWREEFEKARRATAWTKARTAELDALAPYPPMSATDEVWDQMRATRRQAELERDGWSRFDARLQVQGDTDQVVDYERKYLRIKADGMRAYLRFVDPTDPRIEAGDDVWNWKGAYWSFEGGRFASKTPAPAPTPAPALAPEPARKKGRPPKKKSGQS